MKTLCPLLTFSRLFCDVTVTSLLWRLVFRLHKTVRNVLLNHHGNIFQRKPGAHVNVYSWQSGMRLLYKSLLELTAQCISIGTSIMLNHVWAKLGDFVVWLPETDQKNHKVILFVYDNIHWWCGRRGTVSDTASVNKGSPVHRYCYLLSVAVWRCILVRQDFQMGTSTPVQGGK